MGRTKKKRKQQYTVTVTYNTTMEPIRELDCYFDILRDLGYGEARCEIENVPYTAGRDPREHEPFVRQCFLDMQSHVEEQIRTINRQIGRDIEAIQDGIPPRVVLAKRIGPTYCATTATT